MKKRFKQVVSTILITLMALQPLGSASAATQYDPDYVDEIIDEDEEWDSFFSAREASPSTSSNWDLSTISLTNPTSNSQAAGGSFTIQANLTASDSNSSWITAEYTGELPEVEVVPTNFFQGTPEVSLNPGGKLSATGTVTNTPGTYQVNLKIGTVESNTISVTITEREDSDVSVSGSFSPNSLTLNVGETKEVVLNVVATPANMRDSVIENLLYDHNEDKLDMAEDPTDRTKITVTGKQVGDSVIEAYYNGEPFATLTVTVQDPSAQAVFKDGTGNVTGSFFVWKGQYPNATLELTSNATGDIADVVYESDNTAVAAILSANGTSELSFEAVSAGIAHINAYFSNNMSEPIATLEIRVDEVTLTLSNDVLTMRPGEEATTTLSAALKLDSIEEGMGWMEPGQILASIEWTVEEKSDDFDTIFPEGSFYDGATGTITVTAGEKHGNATVTFTHLDSNTTETLSVVVYEPQDNVEVEEGAPAVDISSADTPIPDMPDDIDAETAQQLAEDCRAAAQEALEDISANTEIANGTTTIDLNGMKPSDFNPDIPDIPGVVYPRQTVDKVETVLVRQEDGTYSPIVQKVVYDISLYWKPTSVADNDNVKGYKLNDVNNGTFEFRIPVPSNIGDDNIYANVTHEDDAVQQYRIDKSVTDNWFIKVRVRHFSLFTLEFTSRSLSGSSSSGGGGGGGGSSRSVSSIANLAGNWILDASQRWMFSLTSGGYVTNNWGRINNKWYYFDGNGYMMTGWIKLADKWYFLQPAGDMIENNWYLYNNQWYFLGQDGAMYASRWVFYNNNWYYLNADGAMATNTTTPDGYTVDANGVWVR